MSRIEEFRIDSHKLHLHPERVADWMAGKDILPIYMEVSPSGACNHRCRFCGLDFMGYKPRFLPTHVMLQRLQEMGQSGVKAIMFAGEGEPFLHRDMAVIAEGTRAAGIDVAFTTNAVLLKPEMASRMLPLTSWIKVSCNAGTAETYAKIHGTQAEDFNKVMRNMSEAVRLRERTGHSCTLGFQIVLLPENAHEVLELARRVRDMGADYLVVKPYSQHPQSHTQDYAEQSVDPLDVDALYELSTPSFSVIYREEALLRAARGEKAYQRCLALPFWSYVDAGGELWGCSVFLGDERFSYGNLVSHTFAELWHGPRRHESLAWCTEQLDASQCRINCRMDPINRYLWELRRPGAHVNFI